MLRHITKIKASTLLVECTTSNFGGGWRIAGVEEVTCGKPNHLLLENGAVIETPIVCSIERKSRGYILHCGYTDYYVTFKG